MTVRIACSLPLGIQLDLYGSDFVYSIGIPSPIASVRLNGFQTGQSINRSAGWGLTDVDSGFWTQFTASNPQFPLLVSGSIRQIS